MKSNTYRLATILLLSTASLTACDRSSPANESASGKPGAEQKASVPDEINAAIAPNNIDLAYSVIGGPAYDAADGGTLTYRVRVTNKGKVALSSRGTRPVNLGIVILGTDGSVKTPPGKRDFVRIKLPRVLEPGQSLDVTAKFEVMPTLGGKVVLDAVQERVRWFSDYKKPILVLGSFRYCEGSKTEICTAEGVPISAIAK